MNGRLLGASRKDYCCNIVNWCAIPLCFSSQVVGSRRPKLDNRGIRGANRGNQHDARPGASGISPLSLAGCWLQFLQRFWGVLEPKTEMA
jgi:hypothetical protein